MNKNNNINIILKPQLTNVYIDEFLFEYIFITILNRLHYAKLKDIKIVFKTNESLNKGFIANISYKYSTQNKQDIEEINSTIDKTLIKSIIFIKILETLGDIFYISIDKNFENNNFNLIFIPL